MTYIVGLAGRAGAGKDTAAGAFIARGFAHLKMSGALKAMLDSLLAYQGVDAATRLRMIEGDLKEEPSRFLSGRTPRYAMQTLGTEWGRALMSPDIWVEVFSAAAARHEKVVCSDVRFDNEAPAVDFLLRIYRDGGAVDDHASELQFDRLPADVVLANNVPTAEAFAARVERTILDLGLDA